MDVSVIIPSYNNGKTIHSVLDALLGQVYIGQIEVIVVDDNSRDNTRAIVKNYPVVKVFNEKNWGLAKSLNKGISIAKYSIIVTLHADTIPANSLWLEQLVSPLTNSDIAATCSTQVAPDINQSLTIWEKLVYGRQAPHQAFNDKADAYKKDVLESLGLFDSRTYRTAGEDEDLALRLRMNNKMVQGTKAQVVHDHHFNVEHGKSVLKQLLRKEYSFGEAGGALRRKYPTHKPGSYVFPTPKSFTNDGLFRVVLCIFSLIPYVQLVFLPLLFITASMGVTKIARYDKKLIILYPFFNIARFFSYTIGYCIGFAKGRQGYR